MEQQSLRQSIAQSKFLVPCLRAIISLEAAYQFERCYPDGDERFEDIPEARRAFYWLIALPRFKAREERPPRIYELPDALEDAIRARRRERWEASEKEAAARRARFEERSGALSGGAV